MLSSLAACTALPVPPSAPLAGVAVPATWSAEPAGGRPLRPENLAAWWEAFADPALGPLVRQALAAATDAASARARLEQARAQRDLTASAHWPAVGLGGAVQRTAAEQRSTTGQASIGLDASWEPDFWGGTRSAISSAEASVHAQQATLASARLAIAAEAALQLLQWRGTRQRLAIARDNLASQQQTLQIVRWRHEAGLVGALDVHQAVSAVAQTQSQIPPLETAAAQSLHALAVLTGRPAGSLELADGPQPEAPPQLAASVPAEVLRQRPDVQAAEARLRAAAHQVSQAEADRLPSLRLSGSLGLTALSLAHLGSGTGVASLAASIGWPVFDAGGGQARVRVQQAAWDEAVAAYRSAVLNALRDVEDSLVSLQGLRMQAQSQRAATAAARDARTLAEQRYASGLVDFQTVLQTQRSLLSAEDAQAAMRTATNGAHVRLFKALGGGWLPDEPLAQNTP